MSIIQLASPRIFHLLEASASTLYERLVSKGSFENIEQETLINILRSMGARDLIEQTQEGIIILGLIGEKVVRNSEFYSAFVTDKEIRVLHRGHFIGTVSALPTTGAAGFLILAGRRWKIIEINLDREEILVEPSRGGRLPSFSGSSGPDLHPRIHEKMHEILSGIRVPIYLDKTAKEMLYDARSFSKESNILQNPFFRDGNDTIWFTWCGTRANRTLLGLGLYNKLRVSDNGFALTFEKMSDTDIRAQYTQFISMRPDLLDLAQCFPVKAVEKYDSFLTDELLSESFARNYLDLPGALRAIGGLL